ncbi:MAG: 30S ribosomal protein S6 [Deltaproteobacteria bacterium]|jgi:small subunit ribosomal protein S6|nr:30S ribosomal protein S6 [Deltaproteobacteria bacterium]
MSFRRYETLILLSPQLSSEQLATFKTKVEGILSKGEGQIVRVEEKGRQKLSYPVRKELFGFYILYDYRAVSELAAELQRNLKIDEQVFKFLTIVLEKNFTEEKYQTVLNNIANEASKKEKEQSQASEAKAPSTRDAESDDDDSDSDLSDSYNDDEYQSADSIGSDSDSEADNPQNAHSDDAGATN